jgi:hypothetical protein
MRAPAPEPLGETLAMTLPCHHPTTKAVADKQLKNNKNGVTSYGVHERNGVIPETPRKKRRTADSEMTGTFLQTPFAI